MAVFLCTTTAHGVAAASWKASQYHSPNDVLANPPHKLVLRRESPPLRAKLPFHSSHGRYLISPSAVSNSPAGADTSAVTDGTNDLLDSVIVYDLNGNEIPISDLWKDRKAVVAFARHFGCVLCRTRAAYLASEKDKMDAAGVALVIIGPGSVDQAKVFSEQTKFKGEVYADPSHASYDALKFVSGITTTFTPGAGLKIIQAYLDGYRQDWELSFEKDTRTRGGWRQGGIIVAGPGKHNISYIHKSESDPLLFKSKLKPDSSILQTLKTLKSTSAATSSARPTALSELNLSTAFREVCDLPLSSVQSNIESLVLSLAHSILSGAGFAFSVPSRTAANQLYVPELDRIVLKEKSSTRPFANVSSVRKATITTRIIQLIHQLSLKNIHVTKRDLFYTDVKLFQDQSQSDAILDDVSCILGCTRSSLNVVAAEKGVVVGRLIFSDNGDMIDCTKMGMGGKAIPPNIDRVGDMQSDALFILLVEKDAAYMRLAEDRFYNRFPCIIVTAKGQPDVATRLFLRKMKTELKLPVLALVDSDPYGLKILSVYGCGSKNMSYDSANLTTPDIKWLGVRPSDLDKYKIPEQCRLPMSETDIKTGKDLLEEDFVKKNPGWVEELNLMVKSKQKAEIQALSSFGFQYLTEVYLPLKLQQKDWL
ncbi:DNA topoisomerase 6 subunit A [Salvia miltiorrhiza]|uniref:DNA topoisomerase 6 subunit A n=1 Tax=Salvia miltiorrhiza TaxID=226208 RepID=UPI0025ABFCC9|nr:DNA topoisomerase 6 subunit A [Salvia miltiorrhiza]